MIPISNDKLEEYSYEEMNNYIVKRMKGRSVSEKLGMDLSEAVRMSTDAGDEFFVLMDDEDISFNSDDELSYVIDKTGLNENFVELALWYKSCYEMEYNGWHYIGNNCIDCGESKLFMREMPEKDFQIMIVCSKCGKKMMKEDEVLYELVAEDDLKMHIVKDFEKFSDYIDRNNITLTKKKKVLGKKDAYALNSSLHFKKEVDAPNYQHESYYGLEFLFKLSLAGGLCRKIVNDSGKIFLKPTEKILEYRKLNDYEKYVYLLETFWCKFDFDDNASHYSRGSSLVHFWNLMVIISRSKPGEIIENKGVTGESIYRCFSGSFRFVYMLSCFELCKFEWVERTGKHFEDVISSIEPTQWGKRICNALLRNGRSYFKSIDNLSFMFDLEIEEDINLPFHKLIAYLFPQGAVQETVSEEHPKIDTCNYLLKVSIGKKTWRKIKISSKQTLEDLHLIIQDAFEFDNDHLYAFNFDEDIGIGKEVNCRDFGEEPSADQVVLLECKFYEGQEFTYIFDFGDMWTFKIIVENIDENEPLHLEPEIVEYKGDAPEQYPYFF